MNNHSLQLKLGQKVLELDFARRHSKMGWADIRGLLGTTNPILLNSDFGMQVLHFRPPNGKGMGYDYKSKGLCVVWDLFRQQYRVFGAEQVNIHKEWSLDTIEDIEKFQQYIYNDISKMSEVDKLKFMGYVGFNAKASTQHIDASPQSQSWTNTLKNKWNNFVSRASGFFNKKKK